MHSLPPTETLRALARKLFGGALPQPKGEGKTPRFNQILTAFPASSVACLDPNRHEGITMATRKIYHVVPHRAGWAVKIGKAKRASAVLKTKAKAMKAASNLAKSSPKSQIVIREATGKIKGDRTFEYRDYKKKKKVRATVSKIGKSKLQNKRRQLRLRSLRRKAALLGLARQKRAQAMRRAAARRATKSRKRG